MSARLRDCPYAGFDTTVTVRFHGGTGSGRSHTRLRAGSSELQGCLPGDTILFEADPADGGDRIYACAAVAGCGYLSSTAVEPVLAMWINFERSTKDVVGLYIGENTLRHE